MLILVVDDILETRRDLCALVAELGHEVLAADSGDAALRLIQRQRPDIVLLDLLMPDMDGFDVTRRMREFTQRSWLPVIVTSSFKGDQHFIHALENGADDYLVRPVSPVLLNAKLRHYEGVLALQSRLATLLQRQRDILDNILDPVLTLDAEGRLTELNHAALELTSSAGSPMATGLDCKTAMGVSLPELMQLRHLTAHRGSGSPFPAAVSLSQWHDEGRTHYTLVLRDLTEQQQIDRMKDEFLATVSHELRTPLTSVLGALSLLAGGAAGALPTAAVPLAAIARRNGERLGHLIDDILDLTKLEGDRLPLHTQPQALPPLLREAAAAIQGYAEQAGVGLTVEGLDASPPPQARLDADRFLQVMANLLSNAIKHSPVGDSVRLSLESVAGQVRITVRDRGPGIEPQFRARMFEKFSQADGGDRRAHGGTGLGLYISRMLVERMGGRIAVDEGVGAGASFSVTFPALTIASAASPARQVVIHIDNDFEARSRVVRRLAPSFQVESAAHLGQARQAASLQRVALFLGNPQDQGEADAFCQELKQLAAGRPVILYGDSIDQTYATRFGLPWLSPAHSSESDLQAAIEQALSARTTELAP